MALVAPLREEGSQHLQRNDIDVIRSRSKTTVSLDVSVVDPKPLNGGISNNVAEGQQVSTTSTNQSGISDGASQARNGHLPDQHAKSVFNTSSDINGVIAAVGLDIGAGEGIANLKAVFPLTTEERRLDSRSSQADRVVVLVAVQLDAGEPVGIELKAVCARSTFQSGTNTNTRNLGVSKEGVVTVAAYKRRAGVLRADAVGTSTSANQLVGLSSDQGVTRVGSRDRAVKGRHQRLIEVGSAERRVWKRTQQGIGIPTYRSPANRTDQLNDPSTKSQRSQAVCKATLTM